MAEFQVKNLWELSESETPLENNQNYINAVRYSKPSLADKLEGYVEIVNKQIEQKRLEKAYCEAIAHVHAIEGIDTFTDSVDYARKMRKNWIAIKEEFIALANFKDSKEKVSDCDAKIEEWNQHIKTLNYRKAVEYVSQLEKTAGDEYDKTYNEQLRMRWGEIRKKFIEFEDLLDAKRMVSICDQAIANCNYRISKREYDEAVNEMNLGTPQSLTSAMNQFRILHDFEDSQQLLLSCAEKRTKILKKNVVIYAIIWGIIALWGLIPLGGHWVLHLVLTVSMLVCAAARLAIKTRAIKGENNTELENNADFVKALLITNCVLAFLVLVHV